MMLGASLLPLVKARSSAGFASVGRGGLSIHQSIHTMSPFHVVPGQRSIMWNKAEESRARRLALDAAKLTASERNKGVTQFHPFTGITEFKADPVTTDRIRRGSI